MENDLNPTPGSESPPSPSPQAASTRRWKTALGALLAVVVVVGLYLVNRFWIAPVTTRQAEAKTAGGHPLAPQFTLTDISGQKLSLADYKGKVVMLDFWATWCGPCRIEIPGFVELQNRYRDQGFAIIGISLDLAGPEVVQEFYRQFKMNYPVALGDDKLTELYGGIFGMPTTFLIGRDGRIYAKHVGAMDVSVFEQEIKSLLDSHAGEEATKFAPAGRTDEVELGNPAEANSEVPGVDISGLNAAELARFKKQLEGEPCTCGCKLNLLRCRREDRACGVSRKLARQQLAKLTGASVPSPPGSAVASPEGGPAERYKEKEKERQPLTK